MFKSIVVIALIGFVYANPLPDESDDMSDSSAVGASQSGDYGNFGKFPMPDFKNFEIKFPMPDFKFDFPSSDSIANMKPGPDGVVSGVSTSITSHTELDKDGKPVTKTEGKYVINKNGVVESGSFPEQKSSSD